MRNNLSQKAFECDIQQRGLSPFSKAHSSDVRRTKNGLPLRSLLLPSIDMFRVTGKSMDKLMKIMYGIDRAYSRTYKINVVPNPLNRYLEECWTRLYHYSKREDDAKFDKLATRMLKDSKALRLLALYEVEPTWYKTMKWTKVVKLWSKLSIICNKQLHYLKVRKVEIPKQDGSMRPLGVPSCAYRIYMNMCYRILSIWLWDKRPKWQHGFKPWHGCGTAWMDIYKKVIPAKWAYEFDLTKFFDSINQESIQLALNIKKVPDSIYHWVLRSMYHVNRSKAHWSKQSLESVKNWLKNVYTNIFRPAKMIGMEEYLRIHAHRMKGKKIVVRAGIPKEKTGNALYRGVPQGCNMSPTLAALALETKIENSEYKASLVMYADDGIIYGDDEREVKELIKFFEEQAQMIGTSIHPEKSKWIKMNGQFVVPSFKFLGLRYDPKAPWEIRGESRKGSKYIIPLEEVHN